MKSAAGIAVCLCFALVYPVASPVSAASCPDVDAARTMLQKAAAAKNDEDLKQMPRKGSPPTPPEEGKGQPQAGRSEPAAPAAPQEGGKQDGESPPGVNAPVPEDLRRAALLVKEADEACQAGDGSQASEKARAAMALLKR
ncbi:MAG TPA: hypothetical protein VFE48_13660 [Methylomirabilota bacterium]|nr:hypothetical protein [Methylomirabilota bacterium]